MTRYTSLALGISFSSLVAATGIQAGPLEPVDHPHQKSLMAVHEAQHDVDHAWEMYHRAALGGTVASPRLQAEIEDHLQEARSLMTQAQEAAEQGDTRQVEQVIKQVRIHTTHAIEGSKELKR